MIDPCTCGDAHPHEVARRRNCDDKDVVLWSDGAVTAALGYRIRGVPIRRPRTFEARRLAMRAGRLFLGEVCLYSADDMPELYAACEKAAKGDGLPGTVRSILKDRRNAPPPINLDWRVTCADRDGKPTERYAFLPRMRWPRTAVLDFCGGAGSSGGRYVLCDVIASKGCGKDVTVEPNGFRFHTIKELFVHLNAVRAL